MRRTTLIAAVLGLAATVAGVSQAAVIGPEIPVRGTATFCLSPAAASSLTARSVAVTAVAPATLDASGPTSCVTFPVTRGAVSMDLAAGGAPFDGGLSFTSTANASTLDLGNLALTLADRTGSADAAVGGGAPRRIDLFRYVTTGIGVTTSGISAVEVPLTLAPAGASAFTEAFGFAPVPAGEPLFAATGHVDFHQTLGALAG